jgi:hypothetical protein
MQRQFSRTILLGAVLSAGAAQVGFAQMCGNSWDPADYGIAGRPNFTQDYCKKPPKALGAVPTIEEAIDSARCMLASRELTACRLIFLDDVKITVGAAQKTPADSKNEMRRGAVFFPLTGSLTLYECNNARFSGGTPGKNCSAVEQPQATGSCYKEKSGWQCFFDLKADPSDRMKWDDQWTRRHIAPPPAK